MNSIPCSLHRASLLPLLLFLALSLGLAGAAWAQGGARPIQDPMDDLGSLEPEDGKWLRDEDGREYFVKALPKEPGTYSAYGEGQIRYKHWFIFDLVREDEKNLYIKVYKPVAPKPGMSREEVEARRAEEAKAIAATYVNATGESDRLIFKSFDNGLPRRGMWRNGFDIADVNGDGHLDIVHGPARKGAPVPRIFLGDGAGNWRLWREAVFPRAPYDYGDAAAADFNGDGLTDLAFGFHLRGVLALIQKTPGVFEMWNEGLPLEVPGSGSDASGFSSRAIEIGDWNGDGRPDILALGEGPRPGGQTGKKKTGMIPTHAYGLAVFINQGDGSWKREGGMLESRGLFGDHLAAGDLNADGRLDVVTSANVMSKRTVLHLGDEDGAWQQQEISAIRPYTFLQSVGVADFDGDGRDDIAFGFASWEQKLWRTGVDVILSRPEGEWDRRPVFVEEGRRSAWALGVGDVDGDSRHDVVIATGDGEVLVFLGDGSGGFTREAAKTLQSPRGCRAYAVRLDDLDQDGRDEIVAAFADEGSALPIPEFPVTCTSNGAIMAWKAEGAPRADSENAKLDTASGEAL